MNKHVCYPNLITEMVIRSLSVNDLADTLRVDAHQLSMWLFGKEELPTFCAMQIKKYFFPECGVEYLFAEGGQEKAKIAARFRN